MSFLTAHPEADLYATARCELNSVCIVTESVNFHWLFGSISSSLFLYNCELYRPNINQYRLQLPE